ncbi:uncharacterized protein LOC100903021, partial [Galendromus occidentalis]|uniref:Uncharacterized protein LOC100903021 n=1 Tax=Galendromus occidentalis TaxID=34638 RepID=A0AAJ6QQA6_9ACAR
MAMATAGGQVTNIHNCGVHDIVLRSRYDPNRSLRLSAIELKCISRTKFPILRDNLGLFPAADQVEIGESEYVDILLGVRNLSEIGFANPKTLNRIFAFETIFGWIFGGSEGASRTHSPLPKFCGFALAQPSSPVGLSDAALSPTGPMSLSEDELPECTVSKNTKKDIECLWLSEDLGLEDIGNELKEEEDNLTKALIDHFKKTTVRDPTGTQGNPVKLRAVDEEIKNYINAGFAEPAQPRSRDQLAHYLPIQAVFKANPESPLGLKTRVVKDASARRSNEAGLNDVLHQGPNLLPNLIKVILKFRQYRYAVAADIEKAFQQFRIAPEDRTFLRFLWPLGISTNESAPVKEFWATRLDFGLVCSPFLHCQGVRSHLEYAQSIDPKDKKFIQEIIDTFYMDDICLGSDNLEDAKYKISLLFDIFQEAHMPLKKWASNSTELGEFIKEHSPVKDPSISTGQLDGKFLGIPWNQQMDLLSVPTNKAINELQSGTPSKRKLLRGLAQIFDPLGIMGPTTINAKILLQKLWKSKIGWDLALEGPHAEEYARFTDLLNKDKVSISRHMLSYTGDKSRRELHVFSDASLNAYGCVIYLRESSGNTKPITHFVMAKAKVCPVKPMSIHRLELLGALLASRLLSSVKSLMDIQIDSAHLYTDNSSVLGWVNSEPERWKPYVANRIRRIHTLVGQTVWKYVKSEENPADLISRGADLSSDHNRSLWLKGPQWLESLTSDVERAPANIVFGDTSGKQFDPERRQNVSCMAATSANPPATEEIFFENKFSSWLKAVRFWALMQRLVTKAQDIRDRVAQGISFQRKPAQKQGVEFDAEELLRAKTSLLRLIQEKYFKEETENQCKNVRRTSVLYQYNPVMDPDGLIR